MRGKKVKEEGERRGGEGGDEKKEVELFTHTETQALVVIVSLFKRKRLRGSGESFNTCLPFCLFSFFAVLFPFSRWLLFFFQLFALQKSKEFWHWCCENKEVKKRKQLLWFMMICYCLLFDDKTEKRRRNQNYNRWWIRGCVTESVNISEQHKYEERWLSSRWRCSKKGKANSEEEEGKIVRRLKRTKYKIVVKWKNNNKS